MEQQPAWVGSPVFRGRFLERKLQRKPNGRTRLLSDQRSQLLLLGFSELRILLGPLPADDVRMTRRRFFGPDFQSGVPHHTCLDDGGTMDAPLGTHFRLGDGLQFVKRLSPVSED